MTDRAFEQSLAELEESLESPRIPGELETWAREVARRAADFDTVFEQRVAARHADSFGDIERNDAELMRRVELMRSEDDRLRAASRSVAADAEDLVRRASELEPDEDTARRDVERLTQEGLDTVIAARKQELAVNAWLVESMDRVRGGQD